MNIKDLSPKSVWSHFADLNAIPRPSKKEEKAAQWLVDFGHQLNLDTFRDDFGNVIIKKPATSGKENRKPIILQAHIDMVHQKNEGTTFDFENQGIEMWVDGDWVRAKDTTLGADNGLGVAAIMAILSSNDLAHPPIEALFTLDEEAGMGGAKNLGKGLLNGTILLNLDTEEDHVFTIGCAGGLDTIINWSYKEEPCPAQAVGIKITISGLKGGHSGMDIHLGRGNANKLMNRVLTACAQSGLRIGSIQGGSVRNAIPRESVASLAISQFDAFEKAFKAIVAEIQTEYASVEPALSITWSSTELPPSVMCTQDQDRWLAAVRSVHNGVFRMSPDVPGLVETSSNFASVELKSGHFHGGTLQRSAIESGKQEVAAAVSAPFELIGAKISHANGYPGWKPNPNSPILHKMVELYSTLFDQPPVVEACHAGLECGIIGEHYAGLDMISFGPNIRGAHSPEECASISSTQKFWKLLVATLNEL